MDIGSRLENLLYEGQAYLLRCSQEKLGYKPNESKWSKKEILGHLIDSGISNLQRFTEIQFADKPYKVRKYNQDELVRANGYQHAEIGELLGFWMAINRRILHILDRQTAETLAYEVLVDGNNADLRFLIEDYVDHLHHHLRQILTEEKLP